MKRATLAILIASILSACGRSGGPTQADGGPATLDGGPSACMAMGGSCVLGGARCFGTTPSDADCNPDLNPGGAFCCIGVGCEPGESPAADGGCVETSD